jgi:hypothetical protein
VCENGESRIFASEEQCICLEKTDKRTRVNDTLREKDRVSEAYKLVKNAGKEKCGSRLKGTFSQPCTYSSLLLSLPYFLNFTN